MAPPGVQYLATASEMKICRAQEKFIFARVGG